MKFVPLLMTALVALCSANPALAQTPTDTWVHALP